ncbi:MAG: insulinase family protein [Chitinophagaceae bacterium]
MKLLPCMLLVWLHLVIIASIAAQPAPTLQSLKDNQQISGFTARAVYLNDAGLPMGALFIHNRTGFTFDLLQIESVPQTFIWVNTLPVSDKGEPHTQEHLMITKGNKGHDLNTREGMSLTISNAFTSQIFTAYDFYTNAGSDVFYQLFESYLDALLHPDYTDEEVHREVRNWGVAEDAATKLLRLEEKGSVYNEMKTSMNNVYSQSFDKIQKMLYGDGHPLALNAGGLPEAIRSLNAADIKKFHDKNYHLNNMGAITALPKNLPLDTTLETMNSILNRLQPRDTEPVVDNTMPPPHPTAAATTAVVEYPSASENDPGIMMFSYPAQLSLSAKDDLLLTVFLNSFAGDASTNLYKKFIDGKTREINMDAQGVFSYADNHAGQPVFIGLTDVNPANLTADKATVVWKKIQDELKKIAAFPSGSAALQEFNNRFKNNLIDFRRSLAKFTNTPPLFGGRNTGDAWYQQLEEMKKISSFKKSIVMVPEFAAVDSLLTTGKNFWGHYFSSWKLFNDSPFTVLAKPNTYLLQQQDSAAKIRAVDEIARLKKEYGAMDDQDVIKKYKSSYDANTLQLEKGEKGNAIKFIDNPPLTLDDQLDFKSMLTVNKVPVVASTFNNMTGATLGLALKLDKVPEDKLLYLAMLPDLITQTGLLKDGKATTFEDMIQLQRKQILSLTAYYSNNNQTGRSELVIKSAGNNAKESANGVDWINSVVQYPYLATANLPRIRDLVNQTLSTLRKTMQDPEETWVQDPGRAYRAQNNKLALATGSFLTRTHNVQRLRWMLMDAGDEADRASAAKFLDLIAGVESSRDDLKKLLSFLTAGNDSAAHQAISGAATIYAGYATLSAAAKTTIHEAAKDLEQSITAIPDESLAPDWQYLCKEMKHDLLQHPEKTLADLEMVRKTIMHRDNARIFLIGSTAVQQSLAKNTAALLSGLLTGKQSPVKYSVANLVADRYHQRTGTKDKIIFSGLVNQNSATGVFMNWASLTSYRDSSKEKLLQFLAAQLFAGAGQQSVYTKTTGAGLSYSTGASASPASGLIVYYAERTPLLPQTLSFVIDEIKKTPDDAAMSEYVIALALSANRAAGEYEYRGEAMAADFADGLTPAVVRRFRKGILQLRKDPDLMEAVYKRKNAVYEKILPGYGIKIKDVPGGSYLVIGNEKQLTAYESYLQSKEGADTKLSRLYPRDFWMIIE